MKSLSLAVVLGTFSLGTICLSAQPPTANSYTGLLVAAGCQAAAAVPDQMMPRTTAEGAQNTTYEDKANHSDRNSAAQTGNSASANDRETAAHLGDTCRIHQDTKQYALRLENGNTVRFDDASNAQIAHQLSSTNRVPEHKTKIFRVKVKGSMHAGEHGQMLTLDSIQI